jgi:hypothetical protein
VTQRWPIYIGSREMAKHLDDPLLGIVQADSKKQAEELAAKDRQIASRAMPCASFWAVRVRDERQEGLAR